MIIQLTSTEESIRSRRLFWFTEQSVNQRLRTRMPSGARDNTSKWSCACETAVNAAMTGRVKPLKPFFFQLQRSNLGFPGSAVIKEFTCQSRRHGFNPGLGRSPGWGNGSPLWYSCQGNPMNGGAWQATAHRVTKSQTWLSTHTRSNLQAASMWPLLPIPVHKPQLLGAEQPRVWDTIDIHCKDRAGSGRRQSHSPPKWAARTLRASVGPSPLFSSLHRLLTPLKKPSSEVFLKHFIMKIPKCKQKYGL